MLHRVEIDAEALRSNLEQFRRRLPPGGSLAPVVKSNAYGHGMLEVAGVVSRAGVDWLCVNAIDEAVALRRALPAVRIVILGYVELERLDEVVEHDLRPVVYNPQTVARLDELGRARGRVVPLHVKLETGTHRQGVTAGELEGFVRAITERPGVRLEAVSTHFANIEDTTDHGFARGQLARFRELTALVERVAGARPLEHAACSAASLLLAETRLDLARVGISLYGLWPSRETWVSCLERAGDRPELRPALTWKTRVAQVKTVPEGGYVGYGCTWRAGRPSRIAVLPIGYHEGYDRRLSNVAHVLIRGRRAPVRGRVCMNMTMVDVTDVPGVGLEEEVVLLGRQGEERISAEQLAQWCGTIAYEVVTRIHPGLPRVVVREAEGS